MAAGFIETAQAKINLCLHVTGKRADGFHELESLTVFAASGDELVAQPSTGLEMRICGPHAGGLSTDDDNLVMRAAKALADHSGHAANARLRLTKNLPLASGIGGGSADAAATLRALCLLWRLDLPPGKLHDIAQLLGADVPACVISRPLIMRGIGEQIEVLDDFPALDMVLVNPGHGVSTPEMFRALNWNSAMKGAHLPPLPQLQGLAPEPARAALMGWLGQTGNDLQGPASRLIPQINPVLDALKSAPHCQLARMSGSGATCFGIYSQGRDAEQAARQLSEQYPQWWIWAVKSDPAGSQIPL